MKAFDATTRLIGDAARPDAATYGLKALGLSTLPTDWRPQFIALSLTSVRQRREREVAEFAAAAATAILNYLRPATVVILRSSDKDESLRARGQYDSIIVNTAVDDLAAAIAQFCSLPSARRPTGLVVHEYLEANDNGHFTNESRHAQRNVDFLYEASSLGSATQNFKLARPIVHVRPSPLRLARSTDVSTLIRTVGAWTARHLGRGHGEWILANGRFWLVQFDLEPKQVTRAPLSRWKAKSGAPFDEQLEVFRKLGRDDDTGRWRKTASHSILAKCALPVPPIYILEDPRQIGYLMKGQLPDRLRNDITKLVKCPAVIRVDLDRKIGDWTNLPAKGPVTSASEACAFVLESLSEVRNRGYSARDAALVVHHFITARASAWASATPDSREVKIDATWGLPDGLQAFPYDTFVVNTETGVYRRIARYKDEYLDLDEKGKWVSEYAYPTLARRSPLSDRHALFIARGTLAAAKQRSAPTRVMWFVDTDQASQAVAAMPWIVDDEDQAIDELIWAVLQPSDASLHHARLLQRRIQMRSAKMIRSAQDLADFARNTAPYDLGDRHVLLRPSASLLRDRRFLKRAAKAILEQAHPWHVVLEGSQLSHAPYQLRGLGLRVLSVWEYTRPPRQRRISKLVRDGIPAMISAGGEKTVVVQLRANALLAALRAKLVEEALETFHARGDATRDELADVLAVSHELARVAGIEWTAVEEAEREKRDRRGGFGEGMYLHGTSREGGRRRASQGRALPARSIVRRLRHNVGFGASLIPPTSWQNQGYTLKLRVGDRLVECRVEYHHSEIVVTVGSADASRSATPRQLRLNFVPGMDDA